LFDGIDIVFDNIANKLHVVYSRGTAGYPDHLTHYYALRSDNTWGEYKQVSDYGSYYTPPTVSFSQNRVHVSYEERGVAKSRDKYLNAWQNPETVASSFAEHKIHAHSSKLLYFYAEPQQGFYLDIYVRQRDLNGSSWSSPFLLHEVDAFVPAAANTSDSKTHIVYYGGLGDIYYRNYNGSTWSTESTIGTGGLGFSLISSTSNDLYVTWVGNDDFIKYLQYDAVPLAPQNLVAQAYTEPNGTTHPKLTWDIANEPDVIIKDDAYDIQRRLIFNYGVGSTWTSVDFVDGDLTEYIDYELSGVYQEAHTAQYKIRVRDYNNHYSDFSSIVSINFSRMNKISSGIQSYDYNLEQNYPNPFNPTTQISYSIKSAGVVTLKAYDMLGNEVANLVDERKEPGNYSVTFDAGNLPSGIYIYKITANDFTSSRKLMLIK